MMITTQGAADLLLAHDQIVILAHQKPDGDTLGSCFALLFALEAAGKTARVECADGYPDRYRIVYGDYQPRAFEPNFVVACDVAGTGLLGPLAERYPTVDLCIDHHKSNDRFATHTLLDPVAPAAALILYRVIVAMGISFDKTIATALYTGITTDTGCFRFASVTSATHRIAAELIDRGAEHHQVNKQIFDSKSRGRIEVERMIYESLVFSYDGRCVIVSLPGDIHSRFGVTEDELDGISGLPRRVAGVLCGITIRGELTPGRYRISMRCDQPLDASAICGTFGGGGHSGASGCTMTGELADVQAKLQQAVGDALREAGLCS